MLLERILKSQIVDLVSWKFNILIDFLLAWVIQNLFVRRKIVFFWRNSHHCDEYWFKLGAKDYSREILEFF
jgi:hypothetical protein